MHDLGEKFFFQTMSNFPLKSSAQRLDITPFIHFLNLIVIEFMSLRFFLVFRAQSQNIFLSFITLILFFYYLNTSFLSAKSQKKIFGNLKRDKTNVFTQRTNLTN